MRKRGRVAIAVAVCLVVAGWPVLRPQTTSPGPGSYGSVLSTTPAVLRDGTILWPGPDVTLLAVSPRGRVLWRSRPASEIIKVSPAVAPGSISGPSAALRLPGPKQNRL